MKLSAQHPITDRERRMVGTSRCDVPARAIAGGTLAPLNAARSARRADPTEGGFTMVEIAISLAVIAFALIAIIGVLPMGMNVQKDNREETIIAQDAGTLISAIRSGAQGMDDLTNYIIAITNTVTEFTATLSATNLQTTTVYGYTPGGAYKNGSVVKMSPDMSLTNGARIIGLLSTPRYFRTSYLTNFWSNSVTAYFRAMSGAATEKFPQADPNVLGLAFAYQVTPELDPVAEPDFSSQQALTLQSNLFDLRLTFRWPLLPSGVGIGRQTYRTQITGQMVAASTNAIDFTNQFFIDPQDYSFVPPQPAAAP